MELTKQEYPTPLKSPAEGVFELLRHGKRKLYFWGIISLIAFSIIALFPFILYKGDQVYSNNSTFKTLTDDGNIPLQSSFFKNSNLPPLIREFNNEKLKSQAIILKCAFELINESSLHTNKKYSVANLENISLALKEGISTSNDLENAVQELKKEIKSNDSWFSNNEKYLKYIDDLLKQIYKQKKYLEVHASINEAIFQIQKGNYSGHLSGNEGALLCVVNARTKLEEYYNIYIRNVLKATNNYISQPNNKEAATDELLQIEYLLQKIANLQGIIQKK